MNDANVPMTAVMSMCSFNIAPSQTTTS